MCMCTHIYNNKIRICLCICTHITPKKWAIPNQIEIHSRLHRGQERNRYVIPKEFQPHCDFLQVEGV